MTVESPSPDQIKSARLAAGLSRHQFGQLVYAKARTVESWELGERSMHPGLWDLAQRKINDPTMGEFFRAMIEWCQGEGLIKDASAAATPDECDPTPESRHSGDSGEP